MLVMSRAKRFAIGVRKLIAHRLSVSGKKRQQRAPAKLKPPRINEGIALKNVAYKRSKCQVHVHGHRTLTDRVQDVRAEESESVASNVSSRNALPSHASRD